MARPAPSTSRASSARRPASAPLSPAVSAAEPNTARKTDPSRTSNSTTSASTRAPRATPRTAATRHACGPSLGLPRAGPLSVTTIGHLPSWSQSGRPLPGPEVTLDPERRVYLGLPPRAVGHGRAFLPNDHGVEPWPVRHQKSGPKRRGRSLFVIGLITERENGA